MAATTVSIPKEQTAAVRVGEGATATAPLKQVPVGLPGPGEILVKINWTGLCASDNSLIHDDWAGFGLGMTPEAKGIAGHEGAGTVVAVGEGEEHRWKVGDRAGIKWIASTCGSCEFCTNGVDECHCPNQKNSGFTTPGTFQQYTIANGRYTTHIPEGVSDEEAGPIMCGGVTAYNACKRSNVRPGQWLVIPGAGGGLGHFGVQYAKAMGLRVIAIDGGAEKEALCKKLGAEFFIDFQTTKDIPAEVLKITTHGAHGVIVFPATKQGYETAPLLLRPGGRVVAVGLPKDPTVVAGAPPILVAMKKLEIVGSVVGTLRDVEEALDFTARGLVRPILTKGELKDLDHYCELLSTGKVQHAKRAQNLGHLPPYQTELVRAVTREVRDLDRDVTRILEPFNGSFNHHEDPATACALLVDHLAMRRNKRCLLAYHRGRAEKNPGAGESSLSPEEEEYFRQYSDLLASFKGHWTDIDLTGSLEPPRDLFIDVRVLKDAGEIQTEYGTINLTKNSQFYVRQGDVERLIAQGFLQKLG
ncbi:hypothetical protein DV735_g639, partial [Chaetothyriales sp. CBS 134920]